MVYLRSTISDCESVDQWVIMENPTDLKSRNNNNLHKNKKTPNYSKISGCGNCENAVSDVVRLVIVVSACGVLFYPTVKFMLTAFVEIMGEFICVLKEEADVNPMAYAYIVIGMVLTGIIAWVVLDYVDRKCDNPDCKGLRNSAEFDIQLETEDSLKNSSNSSGKNNVNKGLFELPRDHHRELENELKKMAPSNGRVVLVFRARCGCCIGRMEIPGPKKPRKFKK